MNRLILILILTPVFLFSQGDLNQVDKGGKKQGKWVRKYANGQVAYQGQFKDDKPIGYFIYFYEDGAKKREVVFSKEGTVAHTKAYNSVGKLMAAGKYIEEKRDSIWKFYAEKGWVISEETFIKGKKEGLSKNFFEDGTLSSEIQFKNDKKSGSAKEFYADKSPKMIGGYINDTLEGKVTYYYPGNVISAEGVYKKGLKEGTWRHFSNKGVPESQSIYKSGKVIKHQVDNGIIEEFYYTKVEHKDSVNFALKTRPIPKATYTIKAAKREGPFTEYHNAGKWVLVGKIDENGKEEFVETLQGQKIKCKGNYKNGVYDGKIVWFKLDGMVEKEEVWENGVKK